MADGEKTFAELDKDFFEKYRKKYDEDYKRNQRLERHYVNRGSKYPPMAIEPMPYERNRISGAGMTDADRALRKQWVMDQRLAPHEPVYVPELTHKNVFRRFYAKPWNVFFKALEPTIGKQRAMTYRWFAPKIAIGIGLAYLSYYHLKYHQRDWTRLGGWYVTRSKPTYFPGDPEYANEVDKQPDDFCERGFKARNVFMNLIETPAEKRFGSSLVPSIGSLYEKCTKF